MSELPAAATAPREQFSFVSECDGVRITASNLNDTDGLQKVNQSWRRLVRVSFNISR